MNLLTKSGATLSNESFTNLGRKEGWMTRRCRCQRYQTPPHDRDDDIQFFQVSRITPRVRHKDLSHDICIGDDDSVRPSDKTKVNKIRICCCTIGIWPPPPGLFPPALVGFHEWFFYDVGQLAEEPGCDSEGWSRDSP